MGSMMLPKLKGATSNIPINGELPPDVAKIGYLRKLKTNRKKYMVLRLDSDAGPARLEYYDSEKKCRAGQPPKRSIELRSCFNINRKIDSKHKFALALFTKDDCFALVAETEAEMDEWLAALNSLQQGQTIWDGDPRPKPNFEHVWQVNVKNKGLAGTHSITGPHHLCLTSKALTLFKTNSNDKRDLIEFPLMSIRRCGHSDCFFFMELGRSAITGCGELWMATEDNVIAQNMHETILGAMKLSRSHEDLPQDIPRQRSSSTSENNSARKCVPGSGPHTLGMLTPQVTPGSSVPSMSESSRGEPFRHRTTSEGHHDLKAMRENHLMFDPLRPHSMAYCHSVSYSPPMAGNNPISPGSGAYSDSAGSSLSIDDYDGDYRLYPHTQDLSLHTEPTITEEPSDDYLPMSPGDMDPLDQMISELGSTSSQEVSGQEYMQMAFGGSLYTAPSRHAGVDSNIRTQMFLSLNNQQNDSCTTSPINDYMDMASPSSCFAMQDSVGEGYIPMSPVGSLSVELNSGSNKRAPSSLVSVESVSSGSHGSLPTEIFNGYIPMAPVRENEGYIDMSSLSSSLPKSTATQGACVTRSNYMELSSPSRSSHSLQDISFGSSPTTHRIEEFHLDKVKSFFPPSEDDSDVYIKPARAYSIGSRPQVQKSHLAAHLETSRVRAYSFGSQAASSRRREPATLGGIEAELGTLRNIDARNRKSSSAPLLPSGPLQTPSSTAATPSAPATLTSRVPRSTGRASGGDHNDDLMEIVYHQPAYVRMKSDDHGSRRYSMGSHWQRSNNRASHDPKATAKDDRRSAVKHEGTENPDSLNRSRRSENDYMDIPRVGPGKAGSGKDEHSGTSRSSQESSNKKFTRKPEPGDYMEASNSVQHGVLFSKGPNHTEHPIRKSDEVDFSEASEYRKKTLRGHHLNKSSRQMSECSDYMEMGGTPSPSPLRSAFSLDASVNSSQLNNLNLAGDYVNLDMSSSPQLPEPIEAPHNTEAAQASSKTDTFSHDYINLKLGSLPVSEDTSCAAEEVSKPVDIQTTKANSTNATQKISEPPQLTKQISAPSMTATIEAAPFAALKSSFPISTANNNNHVEGKMNSRRASQSPEKVIPSDLGSGAVSRLSLTEGPYENIQVGTPRQLSIERHLNYASLDLALSSSSEDVPRSPRILKAPVAEDEVPLSYAEIDFTKSEGLRNTSGSLREGRV